MTAGYLAIADDDGEPHRFRIVLNRDVLAHNPEVAGSNPAPATRS
jgi:hypothetical protein